jgi:hypothetical protein
MALPILAWGASELILAGVLGVVGIAIIWMVGHTVERDVVALGDELVDPLKDTLDKLATNTPLILAALVAIYLIMKGRKQ